MATLALTPDGRYLVTTTDSGSGSEPVQVWRVTEKVFQLLALPHLTGRRVAFAPDGRTLAVADTGSVTLLDLAQPVPAVRLTVDLPRGSSSAAAELMFTADGTRLVTVREQWVSVWNLGDGRKVGGIDLPKPPESAALAPDGRHLAVGNKNGTIWFLRLP